MEGAKGKGGGRYRLQTPRTLLPAPTCLGIKGLVVVVVTVAHLRK
jgi:hypothetical protein